MKRPTVRRIGNLVALTSERGQLLLDPEEALALGSCRDVVEALRHAALQARGMVTTKKRPVEGERAVSAAACSARPRTARG